VTSPVTLVDRSSRSGLAGAVVAVCCWSAGNIMVVKVPMDGLQIAFWRIALGAVVYTAIVYGTGKRLSVAAIKATAPAGIVISLEIAAFFVAIRDTTVANTTVMGALAPIVLLGVASRRFGETVTGFLVMITVVAVGGASLVVLGSADVAGWHPRGDALAFVAMLLFAAYFVYAKAGRQSVGAIEFQAALWIVGTVTLAPVAVIDGRGIVLPDAGQWAWLAVLLAVPGSGHLLMNWAHPRVRLVVASMLSLALPVLSTIGAVMFLEASVNLTQVVGIVIVISALGLVIRREAELARGVVET